MFILLQLQRVQLHKKHESVNFNVSVQEQALTKQNIWNVVICLFLDS